MKVISLKICPFVQRVTATLEAKKVSYDIEYIDFDNLPDWFAAVSPNSQVPLIITDNGTALFESTALVEYLDDAYPPLQENISAEQKAINRAWGEQASSHYLVQCSAMQSKNGATLEQRREKLDKAFARVENALTDEPYFQSNTVGNVDMAWLPLLHRSAMVESKFGFDFLKNFPKAKQWQQSILATGICEQSVCSDFNRVFSDFYLSEKTYLGLGKDVPNSMVENTSSGGCCG